MRKWTLDLFSTFLYSEHPRQPIKLKNKESSPLKNYLLPEFAVNPIPSFVQLEILPPKPIRQTTTPKSNSWATKPDYELESKKLKKLGDRGEKIVIDIEIKRLIGEGRSDLAKKVERVSLTSDALGYDILSFEKDGTNRYIEVKATGSKAGALNFFYTANELATAQELNNYFVYIVFEVTSKNPKVWAVNNPFYPDNSQVKMTPVKYRVTINAKD
jgi:hypothetical protein